jgi:prepilin-type N-terminal cleavage/methylation domain-containing protein
MKSAMREAEGLRRRSAGVTLIELLIAVTLLSMLSGGLVIALRVGLSAMSTADSKLTANRRVASVEAIIEHEISGIIPITADCQAGGNGPPSKIAFFQGETQSIRLASSFSLRQGARGLPMILEFQVVPGEQGLGVRLLVNEHVYTGPQGAGVFCLGGGPAGPQFAPIQTGPGSFVIADKLAYCRFTYRYLPPPPQLAQWVERWIKSEVPNAIRIDMAPLTPDASRLQLVTLTIPIRVTRLPLEPYDAYE